MEKVVNKGGVVLACVTAFFVVCIWGTTFVQTKVLINAGLTPEEIFFFRFVLAYVMIVPFAGRRLFMNSVRDELVAIALGLTGGSLYFITENTALIYGYCSNVSLLVCVTPLTTAFLMGWLYPSERMNRKALLGSCVALFGVAAIVSAQNCR